MNNDKIYMKDFSLPVFPNNIIKNPKNDEILYFGINEQLKMITAK